jgi:hypothetical protein
MLAAALLKPVEAGVKVESMGASDVRGCVTDGARGSCVIPFDGRAVSTVPVRVGDAVTVAVCNDCKVET